MISSSYCYTFCRGYFNYGQQFVMHINYIYSWSAWAVANWVGVYRFRPQLTKLIRSACWCWHGFQSLDTSSINQLDSLQLQFSIAAFEAAEWSVVFCYFIFFYSFNYSCLSQFNSAHMAPCIYKIQFWRRHIVIAQFDTGTTLLLSPLAMVMEQTLNAFIN